MADGIPATENAPAIIPRVRPGVPPATRAVGRRDEFGQRQAARLAERKKPIRRRRRPAGRTVGRKDQLPQGNPERPKHGANYTGRCGRPPTFFRRPSAL
jgi:hypothetical protein